MAKKKFEPKQKFKELENGKKVAIDLYKGTTYDDVVDFLSEYGTDEEKHEFKRNLFTEVAKVDTGRTNKKGKKIFEPAKDDKGNVILQETTKMNWLYAKRKFFDTFAPEYVKANKKENKLDRIANW